MTGTILYVGNFRHDHCTEVHYARSFEELGWTVHRIQEHAAAADLGLIVGGADRTEADLVLYTRTPPGLPSRANDVWRELERAGHRTASVHLDLFWGLNREIDWADPLFHTGTVFTADGDHDEQWPLVDVHHRYLRAGVLRAEGIRGRENPRLRHGYDVAFVGSGTNTIGRGYHREWPHRARLLDHLEHRYTTRYLRAGGSSGRAVRGPELNALYRTVPIIVGDSLSQNLGASRFWSDRVYETWGRGGFLLHPRIEALWDELGLNGAMTGYPFGDFDALDEAVAYWLAHPAAREGVRARIQQHVRAHCTYTHRAAEMLYTLGLADEPAVQLAPLDLLPPIPIKEHQA